MRMLLVEDEPEMSRLIARCVTNAGFMVDCVGSLAEAEAALAIKRYALALLDRRLPDGDGLETAAHHAIELAWYTGHRAHGA